LFFAWFLKPNVALGLAINVLNVMLFPLGIKTACGIIHYLLRNMIGLNCPFKIRRMLRKGFSSLLRENGGCIDYR